MLEQISAGLIGTGGMHVETFHARGPGARSAAFPDPPLQARKGSGVGR